MPQPINQSVETIIEELRSGYSQYLRPETFGFDPKSGASYCGGNIYDLLRDRMTDLYDRARNDGYEAGYEDGSSAPPASPGNGGESNG